jgi:preprotein translocase SecE subunit
MSSKSKRKHANKQYNRAVNKPPVSSAGNDDDKIYTINGTSALPSQFSASPSTILSPKELKKIEREKAKQKKQESKAIWQKDKKDKKNHTNKKRPFAFVGEIGSELKKVHWPSFKQTARATGVVFGVVVIFALITLGIDRLLGWLYELLIKMQGE